MFSVDFKFELGQFVRTDLGDIGVVVLAAVEHNSRKKPLYVVDTKSTRWWYDEKRLKATTDRPEW